MFHVTLLQNNKVVDEFDCNSSVVENLDIYMQLGYEVSVCKIGEK